MAALIMVLVRAAIMIPWKARLVEISDPAKEERDIVMASMSTKPEKNDVT